MINVCGESVGSGSVDLQLVKKVVATVGTFGDYTDEIQQTYELGFTPYRLHTHEVGTYVTPFVFMMGGQMYWTLLSRCRLPIERLQQMIIVN